MNAAATVGLSREPEQVKAFRDTWKDGIHSYLSFWRDRLAVARELLAESGSIFVQIGDENVHLVRSLLDEVFGPGNFVSLIAVQKTTGASADLITNTMDHLVWYARDLDRVKYRPAFLAKTLGGAGGTQYTRNQLGGGERRTANTGDFDEEGRGVIRRVPAGRTPPSAAGASSGPRSA